MACWGHSTRSVKFLNLITQLCVDRGSPRGQWLRKGWVPFILYEHCGLARSSTKWAHIFFCPSKIIPSILSFLQSRISSAFYLKILSRAGQLLPPRQSLSWPPLLPYPKQCFSPYSGLIPSVIRSDSHTGSYLLPGTLCHFPLAALTNYHDFCRLKQHKCILLHFRVEKSETGPTGLKSRHQQS